MRFGEEGQGFVEYGWTIVLVGVLVMVIVIILGGTIFGLWEQAWEALRGAFSTDEPETYLEPIRHVASRLSTLL
jgi:Flp pilus assembly pilin Flp